MSSQLTLLGDGAYTALRWCFCNYCNRNVAVVRRRPSNQILCPICRRPLLQELHFQAPPTNISFTYGFPTPAVILGGSGAPSLAIFSTPIPYAFSGDVHNIRMPFGSRSTRDAYLRGHHAPNLHTWAVSFAGTIDYSQIPRILDPNGAPRAARSVVEALPWLERRNTCPMCRYELPTDDPYYEYQRAMRQPLHWQNR